MMKKLMLVCAVVLFGGSIAQSEELPLEDALINQVCYVPDIAEITVDGNLSDWEDSSAVLTFGKWYHEGLATTTTSQYAFNDAADLLYIGITTTSNLESPYGVIEIGTATTDGSQASNGGIATQIQYEVFSGGNATDTYSYFPGIDGTQAGFELKYTTAAGLTTVEIAMPIWSQASDPASDLVALNPGMVMYGYAALFGPDGVDGSVNGADSQTIDGWRPGGSNYTQYDKARDTFGTKMFFGYGFEAFASFALAWFSDDGDASFEPGWDIAEPADQTIDILDLQVFCERWVVGS